MHDHGSVKPHPPVYLSTVALERNRWTTARIPTILAGEWVGRAMADGFYGGNRGSRGADGADGRY